MRQRYVEQVRLLLRLLPAVAAEEAFALEGGSAINLLHRDMPRLSVDIDLTRVPIEDRAASLRPDRMAGKVRVPPFRLRGPATMT